MTAPLPTSAEVAHTPLPWMWDGDDLWHMGDGYEGADPHRYTGITIDKRLRESPILKANMKLLLDAVNGHAATRKAVLEEVRAKLLGGGYRNDVIAWLDTQLAGGDE